MRGIAALVFGAMMAWGPVQAQTYPNKTISIVVPFAAGGTTDILARIVGEGLSRNLGQSVIVENVGGAGGRTGTERVVRAAPDGYTILLGNMGPMAASRGLFRETRYNPKTDLQPIGLVAVVPMVLAVSKASGITNLKDMITQVRAKGEAFSFGSAGFGATSDMAANLFLHLVGTKATVIPYQGSGPAIRDLTGGFVNAVIDQTATMLTLHQGNLVKALAVSGPVRVEQAPDIPTFTESGMPAFTMTVWNAISVPKDTPKPVVERLVKALDAALDDPALQKRFTDIAVPVPPKDQRGPVVLGKLIDTEVDRWAEIFKDIKQP